MHHGWCLDWDLFLPWGVEVANITTAKVRYNPCPPADYAGPAWDVAGAGYWHPAKCMLDGKTAWHDQVYPSGMDLCAFWARRACDLWRWDNRGMALAALMFASHLLHDLTIPHHCLCTIGLDHPGYEAHLWRHWARWWDNTTPQRRAERRSKTIRWVRSWLDKLPGLTTPEALCLTVMSWHPVLIRLPADPGQVTAIRATTQAAALTIALAAMMWRAVETNEERE